MFSFAPNAGSPLASFGSSTASFINMNLNLCLQLYRLLPWVGAHVTGPETLELPNLYLGQDKPVNEHPKLGGSPLF